MPIANSYSFLIAPLLAVVALGVIVLLCRWVFSTTTRDERAAQRLQRSRSRGDYGLLVPIATVRTRADVDMLASVLRDAGIRCTVAAGEGPGQLTVLVFRSDALRARDLVSN